jgi:hypothetical protein
MSLSPRQFFSGGISVVPQTMPTVQGNNSQAKTTTQAGQAGAFFSSESGEKKRTGRGGLSVSLKNDRNANPNGRVGLSVTSIGKPLVSQRFSKERELLRLKF